MAFAWNGPRQDNYDIYVKLIGADAPVRLTQDPATDLGPAWSPDGRWIAFRRALANEKSGIILIPAVGGVERKLTEVSWGVAARIWRSMLSWHPSGRWLVVPDRNSTQEPLGLFLVSVETGERRRLTSPPMGSLDGDEYPAVSPDGRAVVFTRAGGRARGGDLYLLELSEELRGVGEPKRLTSRQRSAGDPAWWPDGNSILFSSSASSGYATLWQMTVRGATHQPGQPEPLPLGGAANYLMPAISRQGRLAYTQRSFSAHIRRLEMGGSRQATDMPMSSTRLDSYPQYSPDGKRIAFASNRSGSHEIWVCDADGSNSVKLTAFGGPYAANPAWSPDGRRIAFATYTGGTYEIQIVSADGGKPERLSGSRGIELSCTWSRDGKWIYFDSDRGGKVQVWKVPAGGGDPVQVTRQGGTCGLESLDGKFVYYLLALVNEGSNTELWRVPAEGGEEIRIVDSVCPQLFAVAERGIYFFSGWKSPLIQRFRFATRKIETVARVEGKIGWGISVSPEDRWLLYSVLEEQSDLMMVEKFR